MEDLFPDLKLKNSAVRKKDMRAWKRLGSKMAKHSGHNIGVALWDSNIVSIYPKDRPNAGQPTTFHRIEAGEKFNPETLNFVLSLACDECKELIALFPMNHVLNHAADGVIQQLIEAARLRWEIASRPPPDTEGE